MCRVEWLVKGFLPPTASCHWTSDPVTVYVRSCKVFTLEFRICMKNALNLTSTVEVYGVSKSGPSANLGETAGSEFITCMALEHHERWNLQNLEGWEPVFGGEPSATPKKTPPFSQSPKNGEVCWNLLKPSPLAFNFPFTPLWAKPSLRNALV